MKNEEFASAMCVRLYKAIARFFVIHSSFFIFLFSFFNNSCSPSDRQEVDDLNTCSYAYHYRNIDSTEHYASKALMLARQHGDTDGEAEALNNLAFADIVRMHYNDAWHCLDSVLLITDNQLERVVAYVQQMRLCQRQSLNREFYDCREQAQQALQRLYEEADQLTSRQHARMLYAESEMAIVTSTYYYYVGLGLQSIEAIESVPSDINQDTIQYLNYLYNVGAGGIITQGTQQEINQTEFDYLMRCFLLSQNVDCPYFAANSLEALAEHLSVEDYRQQLMADNQPAMKFINPENISDGHLPLWLADNALAIFREYGDTYQIAGAYRTLASCCLAQDDYESALFNLERALDDTLIYQAPDLVASIREQLSVAYSAIDQKEASDNNRNAYLDLQERTRQDQRLEARAAQLEHSLAQLNHLLIGVAVAVLLLVVVLILFYWSRKHTHRSTHDDLLEEHEEELREQTALTHLHIEQGQRMLLEHHARISLVNGIMPFIDRMIHEEKALATDNQNRESRIEYIRELTDNINIQNDILTHWIQLRKGELNIHIESFPLQELFDIVGKSRRSFMLKGITLNIEPTELCVKADKVLTLFMLNTLADNARKFTSRGGEVSLYAKDAGYYVEISVEDTGQGMTAEELAHVFERKVIADSASQPSAQGHGFGLLNCKGIIEKYRKLSQIFSVCTIAAESEEGRGSRFYFRLPKKVVALLLLLLATNVFMKAQQSPVDKASAFVDSAYFSNINGTYQRTLDYADSCRQYLNKYYNTHNIHTADTLLRIGDMSVTPPEVLWLRDSIRINYQILLEMRNESAIAALALHQWQLYHYNNRIYTQLFKELSADNTLDSYCRTMQQSQANKRVAIILIVILFIAIIMVVMWQLMLLHNKRYSIMQEKRLKLELMADDLQRLKMEEAALHVSNAVLDNTLSTLKHETMYYPSRIRQLLDTDDVSSLMEVTAYYRELYGILSQQAMHQFDYVKMHVKPLSNEVLGDAVYMDYLFEILQRQAGKKKLTIDWQPRDEHYVTACVMMEGLTLTDEQIHTLFMPISIDNIPYLICREIVRRHAEATNRHACGIRAERNDQNQIQIIITLPRICKTSKSSS